ncbi:MAG: hypothetical protein QM692_15485 [Thermomicrobiales bacterium]
MTEPFPENLDPDAVEAWVAQSSPDDWEHTGIRTAPDLVVRLQLSLERDLYTLLALAARQAQMPLSVWVKNAAREQAMGNLSAAYPAPEPGTGGPQRTG